MNESEHLLVCAAEECAEIAEAAGRMARRIGKALRFGIGEVQPGQIRSNAERLADEMGDLLAVAEMLIERGIITRDRIAMKKKNVIFFMRYATECGALQLSGGPEAAGGPDIQGTRLRTLAAEIAAGSILAMAPEDAAEVLKEWGQEIRTMAGPIPEARDTHPEATADG